MKNRILISLIVLIALALPVSAETVNENQTRVVYSAPSEYCILIPETVVVDGGSYKFGASVMDLRQGEHVEVSIAGIEDDGSIHMFDSLGKYALARLHSSAGDVRRGSVMATFYNGMTESNESFYVTSELSEGAGDYEGNITFSISLVRDE